MGWLPDVQRNPAGTDGGSFVGPVEVGVIHTTESSTFRPGTTYFGHRNWPHFTIIPTDGLPYERAVWQHIPVTRAARALANRSGGVQTNREGVVQIEVVARAGHPGWSSRSGGGVANMRRLMRQIEAATEIPPTCGVVFGGNEQYGLNNGYELSNTAWVRYRGWCGHQHVPENAHWDPGAIDIVNLLEGDDMPSAEDVARAVWAQQSPLGQNMGFHMLQAARADQARSLCYEIRAAVEQIATGGPVDADQLATAVAQALLPELGEVVESAVSALPGRDAAEVARTVVDEMAGRLEAAK